MTPSSEFPDLLRLLAEKTESGKVAWERTYDPESLLAAVSVGTTIEVRGVTPQCLQATMKDNAGEEVARLSACAEDGGDAYQVLQRLAEAARTSAAQVHGKIRSVILDLERL